MAESEFLLVAYGGLVVDDRSRVVNVLLVIAPKVLTFLLLPEYIHFLDAVKMVFLLSSAVQPHTINCCGVRRLITATYKPSAEMATHDAPPNLPIGMVCTGKQETVSQIMSKLPSSSYGL